MEVVKELLAGQVTETTSLCIGRVKCCGYFEAKTAMKITTCEVRHRHRHRQCNRRIISSDENKRPPSVRSVTKMPPCNIATVTLSFTKSWSSASSWPCPTTSTSPCPARGLWQEWTQWCIHAVAWLWQCRGKFESLQNMLVRVITC